ncbi:AAA family ATPase [Methylobacterium sp. C25]|uniref:ATP-binding protein n=1 Tax=Methylobacterium sp. C25 TaxID=2721622 RepID=UPI001F47C850|nr:AAA family ATPase [Methylobacterium sp. C25]MCE4223300.1 AAA family ATPase [Methylobacterium sp. C25]
MRLRRLDLTRYGKFTDHAIDFGERVEGVPDLHIVYGPNEAGKSTTLAAFLDLIFGMGKANPYNFLHPYPTMRVGGALDFADGPRSFVRLKQNQNDLLDGNDRPVAESTIQRDLGGIDREAYRTMFSLDDETLEKGGESILASKGDLGELLFSAGAGLADLSRNLLGLRAEADAFYRYRARGGALADLKARLAALKAEREDFDTIASDYARLIATRDRASAQYDAAIQQRSELQGRLDAAQRSLNALPRLAALRTIRERLAPLVDLPEPGGDWSSELPALQKQEIELGVRLRAAEDEVQRLQGEIDAITVDEVALRHHDALDRLDALRARHTTAEIDLPERRAQARAADLAIAGILARLERPAETEPGRLLLGASVIGRLRELIETRSGLDAAKAAALAERLQAESRLAEARDRLAASDAVETGAPASAMTGLAAALSALRGSDHAARRRLAERGRDAEGARLADRLRLLAPWQGDADDLLALQCPEPATLRDWASDLEARRATLARQAGEVERLTGELGRIDAERAAMATVKGLVDDGEAAALRARREQAWAAHRHDLTAGSADAFEALLRQDDLAASARLGHVADLAVLQQRAQAQAVAEAELRRAEALQSKADAAVRALRGEIAAAVARIAPSFDPATTPAELEGWLTRRTHALAAREALIAAETDLREALASERDGERRLRAALDAAGLPAASGADFAALLASAQDALDREAELRGLRKDVEERERDLAARRGAVGQAEASEAEWDAAWAETCAGCWFGEGGTVPGLPALREMLAAIEELAPAVKDKTGLAYRIEAMLKDQEAFRAASASIAGELGLAETADPLDLARRVGERIREASAERDRRQKLTVAAEEAGARKAGLDEAQAIHAGRKAEMTSLFAVETLAEVGQRLADVGRRSELREQAEAAEREILDALRLTSIGEAEQRLDAADRAALDTEVAQLRQRLDDQDRLCQESFAQRSEAVAKVEAIGGDDKVAEIESRRRTTLLEIEEGAARYLQLRAGTAATEYGLRVYRERHRSAMMTRASEAFRTISRGAYSGLAAQPAKDGETLIALSAGGGSKEADQLSKGTRFQLYLALRVAGYHEFVQARAPLPFIADDIMETFDDFRAEEAFGLLAGMARVGQVIYLTHHSHLCDVARQAGLGVTVHALPGA